MNKMENLENLVNFFVNESNKLKTTTHYSSCLENIQESTAAHSWHLTLMVPIVAEKLDLNINVSRAMKIALVHDLPEYPLEKDYESYLIFNGNLSKDKKDKSEEDTMFKLAQNFPFGNSLYFLWKEY
jgi:putative hydrolase of HD superfamily